MGKFKMGKQNKNMAFLFFNVKMLQFCVKLRDLWKHTKSI